MLTPSTAVTNIGNRIVSITIVATASAKMGACAPSKHATAVFRASTATLFPGTMMQCTERKEYVTMIGWRSNTVPANPLRR